ncbi:hypothetical protein RRG08_023729 [Elysia crispata]|uniref:Endonuclease/exonuclease/phosphatase domain-containing protein n=1 Tax=Elysia crispata TaxID=231223 RepID=A0AAE0ZVL5_9GAST|nr:hypothetical protein RRG08_023729 [Elysia crispata]
MDIVQVYAPTSTAEEEEVEQFYEDLDKAMKCLKSQDIKIVMGDFNAKDQAYCDNDYKAARQVLFSFSDATTLSLNNTSTFRDITHNLTHALVGREEKAHFSTGVLSNLSRKEYFINPRVNGTDALLVIDLLSTV